MKIIVVKRIHIVLWIQTVFNQPPPATLDDQQQQNQQQQQQPQQGQQNPQSVDIVLWFQALLLLFKVVKASASLVNNKYE